MSLFENGTCAILMKPEAHLAAKARPYGRLSDSPARRDMMPARGAWSGSNSASSRSRMGEGVVASHHNDILTFEGADETGPDAQDLIVGLLGNPS